MNRLRAFTRYWVAQLALFGPSAIRGVRGEAKVARYRKLRPGVAKGLTRRALKAFVKGELRP